jgi:hypothetical protein
MVGDMRYGKREAPGPAWIPGASGLVAGGRIAFTATAHLDLCFVVVV